MLKRDWLREYETTPFPEPSDQIVQSWDTALTANESSKFSVCLTFRVRNNNEYYLLDVFREKLEFPELESTRHSSSELFTNPMPSSSKTKHQELRSSNRCVMDGLQGIIAIDPDRDKKTRMHGQTPSLRRARSFLPKAAPWLGDFLSEYLAFPGGRYDDQIDALSQFLGWQSNREMTTRFEVDWGYDDQPGLRVPWMDEMLWRLGLQ